MERTEQQDDLSVTHSRTAKRRWRWIPTSMEHLASAEARVLQGVKSAMEKFYVRISGDRRIRTYKVDSQKPKALPIVLLHGLGGGAAIWFPNIDAIAEHRKLYAFDVLGFASSSRPKFSTKADVVEEELVNSIEEWREGIGLDKFILLGHSFGGFLAAAYSIKHPDRVQRLILVEPWGMNRVQYPFWLKCVSAVVLGINWYSAIRAAGPWGPWFMWTFRSDLRDRFSGLFQDDRLFEYFYHCNAQTPSGETAWHSIRSLGWAQNPIISRPTQFQPDLPITVIQGARSLVNFLEGGAGYTMKELREGSPVDVHIFPGTGHHLTLERPDNFNRLVVQVCAETDRAHQAETAAVHVETSKYAVVG